MESQPRTELGSERPKPAIVAGIKRMEGREDRRDNAGRVHLQRHVRRLAAEHARADLPLGIVDRNAPLRPLHEHDERDNRDRNERETQDEHGRHRPRASKLKQRNKRMRQIGHDPGKDDQARAVTDAREPLSVHPTTSGTSSRPSA